MVGCPCGGFTVRMRERAHGHDLRYERCPCCGRCGCWRLKREGEDIATGEDARVRFNEIERTGNGPMMAEGVR